MILLLLVLTLLIFCLADYVVRHLRQSRHRQPAVKPEPVNKRAQKLIAKLPSWDDYKMRFEPERRKPKEYKIRSDLT